MKKVLLFFAILLLNSCALKKSISQFDSVDRQYYTGEMTIVPTNQKVPDNYVMIGSGSYGDKGLTPAKNCTYEAIIKQSMEDARKMGASLIYVSNVKAPSFDETSCYTINISFYAIKE